MLISPWIVIVVVGCLLMISSIVDCRSEANSVFQCGLWYMLIMVWMRFVFCLVLWIWMMIVAACGVLMSVMKVVYKLGL